MFKQLVSIVLALPILCCFVGCTKVKDVSYQDSFDINVTSLTSGDTKTTLSGTTLSWKVGDNIGLFFNGVSYNNRLHYDYGNTFSAKLAKSCSQVSTRDVYSYYPYYDYTTNGTSTTVKALLPTVQSAPFDGTCDYMVSNVSSVVYNEANMPSITLNYSNHLFSILKVSITNTDGNLQEEKIVGAELVSNSHILSGTFTFDVSRGANAIATFQNSFSYNNVRSQFESYSKILLNRNISLYIIVPNGTYESQDLTLRIITENRIYYRVITRQIILGKGTIYDLQAFDLKDAPYVETGTKTVLTFGDSITSSVTSKFLQQLLGPEWEVYNAGVSGENTIQIMSRTGAIPIYLNCLGGFTIPASSNEYVNVGTSFYTNMLTNGQRSSNFDTQVIFNLDFYTTQGNWCGCANPFSITGPDGDISCEIKKGTDGTLQLHRLVDANNPSIITTDYTLVVPATKKILGNPTLTTLYMGTNGTYVANTTTGRSRDQVLADMYKIVESATTGHFIAVGYQHSYWTTSYRDTFSQEFQSKNNYLDLRTSGCNYAEQINFNLGLRTSGQDSINISTNTWPATWGGLEIHPNNYGAKAYAYLIYYKMKDLGYIDN